METKNPLPAYTVEQLQGMAAAYVVNHYGWLQDADKEDMAQEFVLGGLEASRRAEEGNDGIRGYQYTYAIGFVRKWITSRMDVIQHENVSMQLPSHGEEAERETLADSFTAPEQEATDTLDAERIKGEVAAAVQKLKPRQRAIVEGVYFAGKTIPELCEKLGLSNQTGYNLMFNAEKKLRKFLRNMKEYAA
jgi:RNA polymerase sigma factor (sigma-70 family)